MIPFWIRIGKPQLFLEPTFGLGAEPRSLGPKMWFFCKSWKSVTELSANRLNPRALKPIPCERGGSEIGRMDTWVFHKLMEIAFPEAQSEKSCVFRLFLLSFGSGDLITNFTPTYYTFLNSSGKDLKLFWTLWWSPTQPWAQKWKKVLFSIINVTKIATHTLSWVILRFLLFLTQINMVLDDGND